MTQNPQSNPSKDAQPQSKDRADGVEDGPPQVRKSPEGASPERQIAQEPQQSSGLGSGQS